MRYEIGGHDVEVEVIGDGRPILFVHGLAVDRRVMTALFEPLPSGWRRIYVDLPGHGASKGDPTRASADLSRPLCGPSGSAWWGRG